MSVHRVRREEDPDSDVPNSDDMLSDEELELDHDSLPEALETKAGGRKKGDADEGAAEGGEGVSHYQNSKAAIDLASEVWQGSSSLPLEPHSFVAPEDVGEAIAAARKSQKQAKPMSKLLGAADREASLRSLTSASCEDVDKWLADLKVRVNAEGRRVCNEKQYEAVALVATRVKQELRAAAAGTRCSCKWRCARRRGWTCSLRRRCPRLLAPDLAAAAAGGGRLGTS